MDNCSINWIHVRYLKTTHVQYSLQYGNKFPKLHFLCHVLTRNLPKFQLPLRLLLMPYMMGVARMKQLKWLDRMLMKKLLSWNTPTWWPNLMPIIRKELSRTHWCCNHYNVVLVCHLENKHIRSIDRKFNHMPYSLWLLLVRTRSHACLCLRSRTHHLKGWLRKQHRTWQLLWLMAKKMMNLSCRLVMNDVCVCAFECSTKSLVLHIQRPCLVSTSTGQNMY